MPPESTIEALTRVFREVFEDDALILRDDMTVADIPEWDSFTHIILITGVERQFNVRFSAAEVQHASNVGEFIQLLKGKLGTPA